jgi:hypothetical protein
MDELIKFFEDSSINNKKDQNNNNDYFNSGKINNLLKIELAETHYTNVDEFTSYLNETFKEFNFKIIKKQTTNFECGSSGAGLEFILSLIGGIGGSIATLTYIENKIQNYFKDKDEVLQSVKYGNFDSKKLLLNLLYKVNDEKIRNYEIYDFKKNENKIIIYNKKG